MAQNKYLDLSALTYYNGKIKTFINTKDEAVLAAAKAHAESFASGLASNYDAVGTATTKVNELANSLVKTNTEAIATLNGSATTEGSVAKAIADAKVIIDGDIDAVEAKADAAQGAADKAQDEVDALETLVGSLPEGTSAKSVVEYVNVKTAGIATDAALAELQGQLTSAQGAIDAIEADYLKAADKTALQEQITANADAIDAIEADYLKAADKTELQGKIDEKAAQSALEAEIARAKAAEEKNASDIALILDNPDTEAVDSIKDFITYIDEHGEVATGLQTQITNNKNDIAAMDTAYKAADTALDNRVKLLEGINHEAYVAADTALKTELTTEIGKKADQTTVDAMDTAYKAADTDLDNRLKVVEGALGSGTGSVSELIATAKQEAIDAAASAADTKDAEILAQAKKYADDEDAKIETRVDALEAASSTHALASDVTALAGRVTTAEGEIDALQAAIGEGGSVTVAIADAKKAGTDAQGEVDALEGVVETLTGRVTANEGGLSAHGDRLTALEGKVGDGFVAITNAEIDGLFTA